LRAFDKLSNLVYSQLMAQTQLKELYNKITLAWDTNTNSIKLDLSGVAAEILTRISSNEEEGKALLKQFTADMYQLKITDIANFETFCQLFSSKGAEYTNIIDAAGKNAVLGTIGNDSISGIDEDEAIWGQDGDDVINGNGGNDYLNGGTGNDLLDGGTGNDTYIFGLGDGIDTIYDSDKTDGNIDVLSFKAGITPENVIVKRISSDLELGITGTTDKITIKSYFTPYFNGTGSYIGEMVNKVEQIKFADGTLWDVDVVKAKVQYFEGTNGNDTILGFSDGYSNPNESFRGYDGNDTIYAYDGNDIIEGGIGSDTIYGDTGNDTYIFGLGDGIDTIYDSDTTTGNIDVLSFKEGITPENVIVKRISSDLELGITGTTDKITIKNYFNPYLNGTGSNIGEMVNKVEQIKFAEGTVWDVETIKNKVAVNIKGTAGNDTIYGFTDGYSSINETFEGKTGNDTIYGDTGNDTYIFGLGDGIDTIYDSDTTTGNIDVLSFKEGITPENVIVKRISSDLELGITGTTDKITIKSYFTPYFNGTGSYIGEMVNKVEQIKFADGTLWDVDVVKAKVQYFEGTNGNDTILGFSDGYSNPNESFRGYDGNDTIYAYDGNDIIEGGIGSDTIYGDTGNDTYIFGLGDGIDTIYDSDTTTGNIDVLSFKEGITPENVIVKRISSDLELSIAGTTDKITIKNYFNPYLNGTGSNIGEMVNKVEQIKFAEGTVWDVETIKHKVAVNIKGTAGNDTIYGFTDGYSSINETFEGKTGNDTVYGDRGSDTYIFGLGDGIDTIYDSDTTTGNIDVLSFKEGITPENVIVKRISSDLELGITGTTDKITIKNYFNPYLNGTGSYIGEMVNKVEQLKFADGTVWDVDVVKTKANYIEGTSGNDTLYGFSDGYTSPDEEFIGGAGNDTIYAYNGNDKIEGNYGNDMMYGGVGNDTYIFNLGDGQDIINDYDTSSTNTDIISFGTGINPSDIIVYKKDTSLVFKINGTTDSLTLEKYYESSYYKIEQIKFADSTVWGTTEINSQLVHVNGTENADILTGTDNGDEFLGFAGDDSLYGNGGSDLINGGAGNDKLYGGVGNDIYVFNLGDGQDLISDYDTSNTNTDTISFGTGINPSDIKFYRTDTNLKIVINGTTDSLTLEKYYESSYYKIEQIKFDDGMVWGSAEINSQPVSSDDPDKADTLTGTESDDVLMGFGGNDTLSGNGGNDKLDGGTGNDNLNGGTGNDTYIFEKGYGQDTIYDYDSTTGNVDILKMGEGILPSDITLNRNRRNLELSINGTTDKVTLQSYFDSYSAVQYRIEKIQFTDGTIWDDEYIRQSGKLNVLGTSDGDSLSGVNGYISVLKGFAGSDNLYGDSGNDILDGGTGNDTLKGGEGNDTYIFEKGYGQDTIYDYDNTTGNVDILKMGEGILPSDITLNRSGKNLELSINGTTDKVTLQYYFDSYSAAQCRIEKIQFTDGTIWNDEYIRQSGKLNVLGTSDGDSLSGVNGYISVLKGFAGSDNLYGDSGNDILGGGTGNDTLKGGEGNDTYIFEKGYGQDTIYDYDNTTGNVDILKMGEGILPSDITLNRSGKNLELTINGTTDKVTLQYYFDSYSAAQCRIEKIQFTDGTIWNDEYIRQSGKLNVLGTYDGDSLSGVNGYISVLKGFEGNDYLYGDTGNEILDGGVGNDYLNGGLGNDTYIFEKGYGQDTIYDYDATSGNKDTVTFGEDLLKMIFTKEGNNLKVSTNGTTDALNINSWYSGNAYQIEEFKASDGSMLPNTQLEQLIQAMAAFTQENGMSWNQAIQDRTQDVQNILSQFWVRQSA